MTRTDEKDEAADAEAALEETLAGIEGQDGPSGGHPNRPQNAFTGKGTQKGTAAQPVSTAECKRRIIATVARYAQLMGYGRAVKSDKEGNLIWISTKGTSVMIDPDARLHKVGLKIGPAIEV